MPNIKKTPKPIEIIQVVQRQCPPSRRSKRSVVVSQALFMDEIVGMPVVMKGKDVRIRRARRLEGCHRSGTLMRLPVFP